MPVTIKSLGGGKVQVRTPNGVKARRTTRAKALAQRRLLNMVERGEQAGSPGGGGMGLGMVGMGRRPGK